MDNAHLLTDQDFAFLGGLLTLAEHQKKILQIVMAGNGEILHRLARPENRSIHNLLGAIWTIPKLTREQSLGYISFLLDSAGVCHDVIADAGAVAKRAAGVIGILRMLTITLAIRSLGSEEICDTHEMLAPLPGMSASDTSDAPSSTESSVQKMAATPSRTVGWILFASMTGFIGLFLFLSFRFIPNSNIGFTVRSTVAHLTRGFTNENVKPVADNGTQDAQTALRNDLSPAESLERGSTKTVFRKRTKDGPYSLQFGSYQTKESLLLHLQRFENTGQPLFWNKEFGNDTVFTLFAGRFDSYEDAGKFAKENNLTESTVVFRPFVATLGPLTNGNQIMLANKYLGLPDRQKSFERELVNGMEIQFALERTREDALARCAEAEQEGHSCAVTQFD